MKRLALFVVLGLFMFPDHVSLGKSRSIRTVPKGAPSNSGPSNSTPSTPTVPPPPSNPTNPPTSSTPSPRVVSPDSNPANAKAADTSQLTDDQLLAAHRACRLKAEQIFPDLKVEGSAMLTEANRLVTEYRRTDTEYSRRPDYPLRIAYEASFNLAKRSMTDASVSTPVAVSSPARVTSRPAPGAPGYAENPTYVIVARANEKPKTNCADWTLDEGEVYHFVRFVSQAEYLGTSSDTNDRSYVLVRIDDVFVAESATTFRIPDDVKSAEAHYNALLEQKRRDDEAMAIDMAERSGQPLDSVRHEIRRVRQQQAEVLLISGGPQ